MIALSTLTYDLDGYVRIKENPETILPDLERRVTRTATLDGESSLTDLGFSWSDMTYIVKTSTLSNADVLRLEAMIKTYPLLRIATREGVFLGAMSKMTVGKTPIELTLLIKRKLTQ